MEDSFKEELLPGFIEESRDHLDTIEPGLLEMEAHAGQSSPDVINEVFRAIHSIKGAASFFGFDQLTNLAHVMENLLMMARDGEIVLNGEQIDLLVSASDKLRAMVENIEASDTVDIVNELEGLNRQLNAVDSSSDNRPESKARDNPSGTLFGERTPVSINPEIEAAKLRKLGETGHYFYRLDYSVARHIYARDLEPGEVYETLGSIGTILGCTHEMSELPDNDDPLTADEVVSFLIVSVLEPEYLVDGLELEKDQYESLTLDQILSLTKDNLQAETDTPNATEEAGKQVDTEQPIPSRSSSAGVVTEVAETLRVPVTTLNKLMDLAGELVLSRNQLKQFTESVEHQDLGLTRLMQTLDLVTSDIQTTIMAARLQPAGVLFNKFPRVIRDLSRTLGKEMELDIEGKDVDLDKSVLEALSDPLTHLIRNCADHAIETPAEREKLGKPRWGKIRLKAYHKNEQIHIEVSDDGRGIDPEVIKARVLERNLMAAGEIRSIGPRELKRLIFLPGFSTAEGVTSVSGRGVGLDVVKTNIEKLGGSIDLDSAVGRGTRFTLRLPLTLAIIPAQIVEVDHTRYALPQVNLEEMVRVGTADSKHKLDEVNGRRVLRLRGELLPLIDLHQLLCGQDQEMEAKDYREILVLSSGANRFGLVVHSLLDREEIVVKPLSAYVKACRYYAGATILGDGRVAMILDIGGLAEASRLEFTAKASDVRLESRDAMVTDDVEANFLVFEDGVGRHFALPLQFVARVDKVRRDELVSLDGQTFTPRQDRLMRVVWLHDYLHAEAPSDESEFVHVITPRIVPHPIGIAATAIHDVISTGAALNCDDHPGRGVLGSSLIDGNPVLFLDIYELLEMAAPELYPAPRPESPGDDPVGLLVAEGNTIHRAMLRNYFHAVGLEPRIVETGHEALSELQSGRYRSVMLAEHLPGIDTPALIRQLQATTPEMDVRLIGLSERSAPVSHTEKAESAFCTWILKFDRRDVIGAVAVRMAVEKEAAI